MSVEYLQSKITYKENPWVGGGNGGEALEVLAGGLELATLVFMDLEEDPEGEIELKGIKFKRMPRSIVDTGYGLERLVWASQGTSTIYESVFPDAVSFLTKEANLVEKLKSSGALISENAKKVLLRRGWGGRCCQNVHKIIKNLHKNKEIGVMGCYSIRMMYVFEYCTPV